MKRSFIFLENLKDFMLPMTYPKSPDADYASFSSFSSLTIFHIMALSDLALKLHVSEPLEILDMVSGPKNPPSKI
jgi:hypothetical protein